MFIHTDGGARGNPGPAACAFVVTDHQGHPIYQSGLYLGTTTNNQAEYQAVIEALKWISNLNPQPDEVRFFIDSQLVVNQIRGEFKVKEIGLQEKKRQVDSYLAKMGKIAFNYVPREQNGSADLLVNQTLDQHSQSS